MPCQSCGTTGVRDAARCPDCGASLGVDGTGDRTTTDDGRSRSLVADGGEPPADDSPTGDGEPGEGTTNQGESTSDQSTSGQPTDGQPTDGQPGSGQPPAGQGGGQPPSGQPTDGQPQGGQPPQGQPSGGGPGTQRSGGGQPTAGQPGTQPPAGGQPAGGAGGGQPAGQASGQPAGGRAGQHGGGHASQPAPGQAGQPAPAGAGGGGGGGAVGGGYHRQGESGQFVEALKSLPFGRGAVLGFLSLLAPLVVVVGTALAVVQQRAVGVGADLFLRVVSLASGERIVELFVLGSDVSSLDNVHPADYPSVQDELERTIDVLSSNPEALLLGVYVLFPLVLYLSGRYLARAYIDQDDIVRLAAVPLTLVAGTLPVTVLIAAAFPVAQPGSRILVAGVFLPLLFGLVGAFTAYGFRTVAWWPSKVYGWAVGILGVVLTTLLHPLTFFAPVESGPIQSLSAGIHGYVATVSFGTGLSPIANVFVAPSQNAQAVGSFGFGGGVGIALVPLTFALVAIAGFVRVYRSDRQILPGLEAVRVGGSIVLGFLPFVALLGVVLAPLVVLVGGPVGLDSLLLLTSPNVGAFITLLLVGGTVVPLAFGGLGGYLAAWYQGRQRTPAPPQQRSPPQA